MEYKIIEKLMPETPNPASLQTKIDSFQYRFDVDESAFNEILSEIELSGFSKGMKIGYELCKELNIM